MNRLCLSANLRKTERLITRHYDAYLADAGVTAVQLPILATIASVEGVSFRILARELGLDRSTLSRNLALLQRDGLVSIGPSSGPKPGVIALTDAGTEKLAQAHVRWNEAHASLTTLVPESAIEGTLQSLRELRRTARQITPAE